VTGRHDRAPTSPTAAPPTTQRRGNRSPALARDDRPATVRTSAAHRGAEPPGGHREPARRDRDNYRHWIDDNGDCQDTRDEVLTAESKVRVSGCDIRTGRWFSYYDRRSWTNACDVDFDHLFPLKESWDSGAKRWNADTRKRYANDLGGVRSLVAVTDNVNQSKSDRESRRVAAPVRPVAGTSPPGRR
jgi:Protein of unknown function (DUF1524)